MMGFYRNNRLSKTALLFFMPWLLVTCSKNDPKEQLQRGVEYFKQGDYEKAKLELKSFSQSDKNTAETYYYLALLDEKNHQYKAMRENLEKVIELEPKNADARLKLGKLLLPLGEPEGALEQAEVILKDTGENSGAWALKASVFIRQKKHDDALAILNTILQKNPNFIEALSLKALIYNERQQADKAIALLDVAMAVEPKNVDLHFFKIQLHAKAKNMLAVIDDYQTLEALYPDNQDYKITLARLYTQMGKNQQAEQVLRGLIAAAPDSIKPKMLLLDFLMDTSIDKVADQLRQFVEHYHDEPRRLLDLANWAVTRTREPEAVEIFNQIVNTENNSLVGLSAKTGLAKMAFDRQDIAETEKLVGEILEENSNYNDAKVLQARIFLVKKQYNQAQELLNNVLLSQPGLEEALLLSAQTFLALGDQQKATHYFENTLRVNPANVPALSYLYDKALSSNKLKNAKDMVLMAVRYEPNNLEFLEKLTKVSLIDADIAGAKDAVEKIADSSNPLAGDLANYLRAKILQAEGDCGQAIGLYKALLVKFPGNKDTLDNMASCFEKLNKRSEMIVVLNELRVKNPSNLSINLLLADLLLADKKIIMGTDVLTELIKNNTKVPQAYIALAKFKLAQNNKKAALAVYNEGLQQNPDNIKLSLLLATLYQQQGDNDLAVSVYESLLDKNPNLEIAINNFVVLLCEHYPSPEMLEKAAQLAERFKNSEQPYYKDTYAWVLVKQGKIDEGITALQEVIISSPDTPIFRYHLGVAYAKSENNGSAMAELQQFLELANNKSDFPEAKAAKILLENLISKTRGH